MEASEAALSAPETSAPATAEAPATPDVTEQYAALGERLSSIESRLPAPEAAPEALSEQDLIAALTEEDGEHEEDGYAQDAYGEQQQPEQDGAAELDAYVRERVAEGQRALQEQIEQRFRAGDLAVLAEKYPALREPGTIQELRSELDHFASRYGEGIRTDPGIVEKFLQARQAGLTSATETPATEARGQGAHLETGTGASGDPGVSPEENIVNEILNAGGGKSAFAG